MPLVNGVAALTVSSLSLGTHAIQAYYHGDATHDSKYSVVLNQGIINKTDGHHQSVLLDEPRHSGDSVQHRGNG